MKKILVALDTSPRAAHVLAAAVDLAARTDAQLLLFRVYGLPEGIPVAAYVLQGDELMALLERDARHSLATLAQGVVQARIVGTRAELGVPWQQICEVARKESADLIVIGAHGYGGIDRLLGTTAARVVNHADRSVLVVRT